MKPPGWIFVLPLAVYSAMLAAIELNTSQDYVRHYFADIEGEVVFHAVNTSLSASLLGGAALLLAFTGGGAGRADRARSRPFLLSQAAMFALLALDDRFLLHERLGWRLDVPDHYVMAVWAAAELALLALFCRPRHLTPRMAALFAAGTGFFCLMMVFDAVIPANMVLRLSIEDLAKTWGAAMFFGFGWTAARFHLHWAPSNEAAPENLNRLFSSVSRWRGPASAPLEGGAR